MGASLEGAETGIRGKSNTNVLRKVLGTGLLTPAMNKILSILSGTVMESALHNGIN